MVCTKTPRSLSGTGRGRQLLSFPVWNQILYGCVFYLVAGIRLSFASMWLRIVSASLIWYMVVFVIRFLCAIESFSADSV